MTDNMNRSVKKVAIIGAGASGLTAIKCCLDENLEPTCFERTDEIGGLWNFTKEAREGQACVMKSTVINTSKEMMCYSDFPIPKEYPVYMHNKYVREYFNLYAGEFNLKKYIRFKMEIVHVRKCSDFSETGQWDIQIKDNTTGNVENLVFDAVMICTGHHAEKKEPYFQGMEKFKGKLVHSHDYKDSKGYEDKRVVVVGIGNSGVDVAVELSRITSQTFLSTRRGAWIFHRVATNGMPGDMEFNNRITKLIAMKLPRKWIEDSIEKKLNTKFDHSLFSLQPKHSPLAQHPTVNDELPNRIISGSMIVKSNIKQFTETGIVFDDDTFEDNIDAVIFATGYIFGFPFLDKTVLDVKDNKVNLFKYIFPPDLEKPTLAVIGCIQPLGAIMPISEQQCRLFTRVVKGSVKLPSKEEMWENIHFKANIMDHLFVKSTRHTIQVDYVLYMDELAEMNGNKPKIMKLMLTDPVLGIQCLFGSTVPYQYRIMGPGKWPGAREAIMTQWDRINYSLKTRPLRFNKAMKKGNLGWKIAFLLLIIAMVYRYFFS